ncbi:hypothetical protein N7492_006907 [Penicillium capsulatum]|uniref:Uncharacterized protein n=1 Tax=Penicillium capsulatum TaxID=69766 RepID=A0A9W9I3W7_9EURO|nr:hypothetical protein N7492_006907 [Penicillium capsulatum]KAJ6116740.1 hypothetical protein N7512_006465 [Penicillium capsulatum]
MSTGSSTSSEGLAHPLQIDPGSSPVEECDSRSRREDSGDALLPEALAESITDIIDDISDSHEKQIFDHFAKVTVSLLTLPLGMNKEQMMDLIIRNIQRDPMIITTALCLGASHLINRDASQMSASELQNLAYAKDRLWEQSKNEWLLGFHAPEMSARSSAEDVARCELLILNNLLQYLIYVSEGLINESSLIHLDHARGILTGLLPWFEQSNAHDAPLDAGHIPLDRCLVHLFLYYDALANVTGLCNPPHPPGLSLASPLYGGIQAIGIHDPVVALILRIRDIQSEATEARSLPGKAITDAVGVWQDVNNNIMSPEPSDSNPGERLALESHLVAASIWLYSIIHPNGITDDKAQEMVQRGIQGLESLSTLEMQSCSLFPFFVIGVSCIRVEDRVVLVRLFDRLDRLRHLRYTRACMDFIRKTWTSYDEGPRPGSDWNGVMKGKATKVLVT